MSTTWNPIGCACGVYHHPDLYADRACCPETARPPRRGPLILAAQGSAFLAAALKAQTERDLEAAVKVRVKSPMPSGKGTGRCACGKTISRNKACCLACHLASGGVK